MQKAGIACITVHIMHLYTDSQKGRKTPCILTFLYKNMHKQCINRRFLHKIQNRPFNYSVNLCFPNSWGQLDAWERPQSRINTDIFGILERPGQLFPFWRPCREYYTVVTTAAVCDFQISDRGESRPLPMKTPLQ